MFGVEDKAHCVKDEGVLVRNLRIGMGTDDEEVLEEVVRFGGLWWRKFGLEGKSQ